MEIRLTDNITVLKGIGTKTADLFRRLNVETVEQLLHFYPRDYDQMEEASKISELREGGRMVVRGTVVTGASEKKTGRLTVTFSQAADETGKIQLTFFNMPYLKSTLKKGAVYYFRGRVIRKGNSYAMEQPVILSAAEYEAQRGALMPLYPLTAGLNQKTVRKSVKQVISEIEKIKENRLPDRLPKWILDQLNLMDYQDALTGIHYPKDGAQLAEARKRLVFDEFLIFLLLVRKMKDYADTVPCTFPMIEVADTGRFLEKLPFRLTEDQLRAWQEISGDLTGNYTMNRLIQGDVGSGKTILAVLALLLTVANGYQGAMMAPTEVLAVQHFLTLQAYTDQYGLPFKPVLLTGSLTAKEKREAYEGILSGEYNLILGTHALIQEKVKFRNLALVITDEQHRFGVRQRESFAEKGKIPHVMVMSATPIPRTLAMILYGDLRISVIKQLPAERRPIKNCVVGTDWRTRAYRFIGKEIEEGRQTFVICPMVEPSEESDLENVEEYCGKLREVFPPQIRIEMLHGKMKAAEKNRLMNAFAEGAIDILVSTTVIEVGVNIPNAAVMMIENAERFGLAQLHQLRGRVGRGKYQSYCIFVNGSDSEKAKERLNVLNCSNDGFYIAEQDLKLRGPGDLFGIRQSGIMNFQIADIYQDADVLTAADKICAEIMEDADWEKKAENKALTEYLRRQEFVCSM